VQDGEDGYELVNLLRDKGVSVDIYLHGEKYRISGLQDDYKMGGSL
jgi:hypothetical protein